MTATRIFMIVILYLGCVTSVVAAGKLEASPNSVTRQLTAGGIEGGPFFADKNTFTIMNTGDRTLEWRANTLTEWLTISIPSGTLTPGQTQEITLSINSKANDLKEDVYAGTVTFFNDTNGDGTFVESVYLVVNPKSGPVNDNFQNAAPIGNSGGGSFISNAGATLQTGEPDHGVSNVTNSIWYHFTTDTSKKQYKYTTYASRTDTVVSVFTGNSLQTLERVATNDDGNGSKQSYVRFDTEPNTKYYVAVSSKNGATGGVRTSYKGIPVTGVFAAVLPYARSGQVGKATTAFATIINSRANEVTNCRPRLPAGVPAKFSYQTTDASNNLSGNPNEPANIPSGGLQGFVFSIAPDAEFTTELDLIFSCSRAGGEVLHQTGLNTFILSAANSLTPDLVAIAATTTNNGVVEISGPAETHFFSTAAINIGSAGQITASADDGRRDLPITLTLCRTNPSNGQCLAPPSASATTNISTNQIVTYTVFVKANGNIPFDPAKNRLFLRLKQGAVIRGATNVAVRTKP